MQLPIAAEGNHYTCGAHLLGVPDAIAADSLLAPAAAVDTFRTFLLYLLADCREQVFRDGDTLRLDADGPRYKLAWEPCKYYDEDDFFFNSFGRWRFTMAPPPPA